MLPLRRLNLFLVVRKRTHKNENQTSKSGNPETKRKMVKAHIERVVDVPVERAWEIISDFSNVHKIHPLVGTVDQLSENGKGLRCGPSLQLV